MLKNFETTNANVDCRASDIHWRKTMLSGARLASPETLVYIRVGTFCPYSRTLSTAGLVRVLSVGPIVAAASRVHGRRKANRAAAA